MRLTAAVVIALSVPLVAQNPPSEPRFDVVSIKPHTGPALTSVQPSSPGSLRRLNVTVQALVLYASSRSERGQPGVVSDLLAVRAGSVPRTS